MSDQFVFVPNGKPLRPPLRETVKARARRPPEPLNVRAERMRHRLAAQIRIRELKRSAYRKQVQGLEVA
jgi:hypothetical protein